MPIHKSNEAPKSSCPISPNAPQWDENVYICEIGHSANCGLNEMSEIFQAAFSWIKISISNKI